MGLPASFPGLATYLGNLWWMVHFLSVGVKTNIFRIFVGRSAAASILEHQVIPAYLGCYQLLPACRQE